MKILLVHNYYQYKGGEETYFESLIKLLKKKGHKIILYTKKNESIKTIWNKINVVINMFWNFQIAKELSTLIKKEKPDIALFQNIYPLIGPTAYWVCKNNNIPIIQRVSNYRLVCPQGLLFRKGKICELCVKKNIKYPAIIFGCYHHSRLASFFLSCLLFINKLVKTYDLIDFFIFPTGFIKKYYLKYLKINEKKTIIIPTFSDNFLQKKERKNFFIYAGRLSEEKGIIQLLEIFKKHPEIKIKIVGDGPLRKKIINIKKYNNILLKGHISKNMVKHYMSQALFTVIPSLCLDVLPNTLIESYSVGTPVIVPKLASLFKLVKNKRTGILYDPNDNKDLERAIIYGTNIKSNKMNLIRKTVKEEYKKKYSEKKHYNQLISLYRKIIR
jgi:glycosyltransferase involved in cell wall biosynthesis